MFECTIETKYPRATSTWKTPTFKKLVMLAIFPANLRLPRYFLPEFNLFCKICLCVWMNKVSEMLNLIKVRNSSLFKLYFIFYWSFKSDTSELPTLSQIVVGLVKRVSHGICHPCVAPTSKFQVYQIDICFTKLDLWILCAICSSFINRYLCG